MEPVFTDTNEPKIVVGKDGLVTITFQLPPKGAKLRESKPQKGQVQGKMLLLSSSRGFQQVPSTLFRYNLTCGMDNAAFEDQLSAE